MGALCRGAAERRGDSARSKARGGAAGVSGRGSGIPDRRSGGGGVRGVSDEKQLDPPQSWSAVAVSGAGGDRKMGDRDRCGPGNGHPERCGTDGAGDGGGLGVVADAVFFDKPRHEHQPSHYRPINACQFGAKGGQPVGC